MSTSAIMIDQTGNRSHVSHDELKPMDYDNMFLCDGILDDGTPCGIPLRPAEGAIVRRMYFYPAKRELPHRPGCPCSRRRKTTIVETLDRRGAGKTSWELYAQLSHVKSPQKKQSPKNDTGSDITLELDNNYWQEKDSIDDKDIRKKQRMPRSTEEYARLLMSLSIDDHYTDHKVAELILDERTVEIYRGTSIPVGKPFMVMCRRTLPYGFGITINNNQWILIDYWATGKNARKPIIFVLNVDGEAKHKLINLCRIDPSVKICVLTVFHKHPTKPQTYVSALVTGQMIAAWMDNSKS